MATTRRLCRRIRARILTTATARCAAGAMLFAGTAWVTWNASSTPHRGAAAGIAAARGTVTAAAAAAPARSPAQSPAPTPLAAAQLPAAQAEQWDAIGSPSTRTVTGHTIAENECAKVAGARTWTQQGFSGADDQNGAVQDVFSFATPAAAQNAYTTFSAAMAGCQGIARTLQGTNHLAPDAVVRQTAAVPKGLAWERTWTGVMGMSAPGLQINHVYLAVDGTRLTVLQFTEFPGKAAAYAVSDDPHVLTRLAS
jgi:Rieske Fe-S protein